MKNAIDRLAASIPPPLHPTHTDGSWGEVENNLGWNLPSDYKEFIKVYGTGGFFPPELFVWNLFCSYPDVDQITNDLQFMEDADDQTPFPELLKTVSVYLWGQDGVGSKYFWARDGKPDNWYVIVTKGRLDYFRFPDLSLSEFLMELLVKKNARITSLYADLEGRTITFKSVQ